MKSPKSEFLELTRKLNAEARQRILSRMRKKLLHSYLENRLTEDDVIAIQLEREDENLKSWQAKIAELLETHAVKVYRYDEEVTLLDLFASRPGIGMSVDLNRLVHEGMKDARLMFKWSW